jgi:ABC-type nitrate/sulfonate/bicarbonate transport system substrate-binding protein
MALINGQMELTTNPNVFDAMVAGKFRGKVIYVTAKSLGHRFIVAPDIKSFDDLKGKTIAISTFGGLTDMLTREILEQHGIRPHKDVALLQLGTPDLRYGALKAGTVKAALVSSTPGIDSLRRLSRAALRSTALAFAHCSRRRTLTPRPLDATFLLARF